MKLRECMSRKVETVSPRTDAEAAWNRMQMKSIRHLVVAQNGKVMGIVSDRDLGGRRGAALRKGSTVAEVMTRGAVTATPDTTLKQAANLLRGRSIGCLPVLDGQGRLQGIVTITDILDVVGRGLERIGESPDGKKRQARRASPRRGAPPGRK